MTWEPKSEATRERLRALWLQVPQLSTAEIGRQMGANKNAIVGLANRLDLPARPSPIRGHVGREKPPEPDRRLKLHSLPPLASVDSPAVVAPIPAPAPAPAPARAVRPAFTAPPPKPPTPLPYRRVTTCSYVTDIGRFGVGVTFCDDPTVPGKPYCLDHARRCFVRARARGEVADAAD